MSSATGIPDIVNPQQQDGSGEDEPLLGRAGDASQKEGRPLYYNLVIGTAILTQAGIVLLVASIWASIFLHDLILFSAHPLLNSTAILLATQSILILQPTHTPSQKRQGTQVHFILNLLAVLLLVSGLIVIEYNKFSHSGAHFASAHAILGLVTYVFLLAQALVGFTQYYTPALYGGVERAKSIYKWHRLSGYVDLTLLLVTVVAATQTDYVKDVLDIKIWAVGIAGFLVLVGVVARIKKQKLGITSRSGEDLGQ